MKRVLIEGSIFSRQVASGISNYLSKIVEHGIAVDHELDCSVLLAEPNPNNIFFNYISQHGKVFIVRGKQKLYRDFTIGPNIPVDIFHSPYMFLPPRRKGTVNLLTVHDLINFQQPFSIRGSVRALTLRLAISRADHFICISDTTKGELIRIFPSVSEEQIHVIPQGIDNFFIEDHAGDPVSLNTAKPYILYVGAREGYKNFSSLVNFLKDSIWKDRVDVVCVGGGSFTSAEVNTFRVSGLHNVIHHAGFITSPQLKFLYSNAVALMYTSLAEGFGLPILEAMASGCPVVCGNFSSMKEVANGNAIGVDDFSAESFEKAMARVEGFTSAQRERAKIHARRFSWERTARETMTLYKRLASPEK